jgi:hypothetical protein
VQSIEVGQPAGVEIDLDRVSELSLAGAVMRERKQADHDPTSSLFGLSGQQRLERAGIGPAREQLIAVDQIEQCHRLLAQCMDDVMVVDHMTVLAAGLGRPASAVASAECAEPAALLRERRAVDARRVRAAPPSPCGAAYASAPTSPPPAAQSRKPMGGVPTRASIGAVRAWRYTVGNGQAGGKS